MHKQFTFGRLPRCLCFHIQRTTLQNGIPSKRNDFVQFPLSLDMNKFVYTSQMLKDKMLADSASSPTSEKVSTAATFSSQNPYQLTAVVMHLGELNSGHYVTFRRGAGSFSEAWFVISDDDVEEISEIKVLQAHAYMLFYEKQLKS